MRIRWRGLELPSRVIRDQNVSTRKYGKFIIEPFERGFGTTIGNSLRRILLSSLEGSAVTQVRIAGVDHEFTSLEGVLEDVTDIILNIKSLIVDLDSDEPKKMRVERRTAGEVKAGDFQTDASMRVINTDSVLATLTADVPFSIEATVRRGRGYVPALENVDEEAEAGVIAVDSLFSPVTRVRYRTEDTRVGQNVNFDRLVLEIWTKGTIAPEDALVESAKILRKHLNPFVQYHELGESAAAAGDFVAEASSEFVDAELQRKLDMPVSMLDLSVRASNCLEAAEVNTIGELAALSEDELLQLRSFGRTSLIEVKRKLANMGLGLSGEPAASTAGGSEEDGAEIAP